MKRQQLSAGGYFQQLKTLVDKLDFESMEEMVDLIWKTYQRGGTIFFMGNGGSAAIASHLAADIGKNVMTDYKNEKEKRFRTLALTDNAAWLTALANDIGYENVFLEQLKNLAVPGDVAVLISSSGNSANVVKAAQWARENKIKVATLVGFSGGKLKELADVSVWVQANNYGFVEGLHGDIQHYLVEALKEVKKDEVKSS